jgi:signal recognition particle receptor subunit beta
MVTINYALREINCKIVYYGPGLSGKTTNLQFVHGKVPATARGDLISLATEADRTLYFDFLPVDVGKIAGFDTKFQLYTVPGQVFYNATRRLVLRGVDGLVFVADSQASKMDENIESLNNMYENLIECGITAGQLPLVFQWNKRDLPDILPVADLEARLNPLGLPSFEAVATTGAGVFDTLKKITKMVLEGARARAASKSRPATVPDVPGITSPPIGIADVHGKNTISEPLPGLTGNAPDYAQAVSVGVSPRPAKSSPVRTAAMSRPGTAGRAPSMQPATMPVSAPALPDYAGYPGDRPATTAPGSSIHREPSLKVRSGSPGKSRARHSYDDRDNNQSIFARFFRWILGR